MNSTYIRLHGTKIKKKKDQSNFRPSQFCERLKSMISFIAPNQTEQDSWSEKWCILLNPESHHRIHNSPSSSPYPEPNKSSPDLPFFLLLYNFNLNYNNPVYALLPQIFKFYLDVSVLSIGQFSLGVLKICFSPFQNTREASVLKGWETDFQNS